MGSEMTFAVGDKGRWLRPGDKDQEFVHDYSNHPQAEVISIHSTEGLACVWFKWLIGSSASETAVLFGYIPKGRLWVWRKETINA